MIIDLGATSFKGEHLPNTNQSITPSVSPLRGAATTPRRASTLVRGEQRGINPGSAPGGGAFQNPYAWVTQIPQTQCPLEFMYMHWFIHATAGRSRDIHAGIAERWPLSRLVPGARQVEGDGTPLWALGRRCAIPSRHGDRYRCDRHPLQRPVRPRTHSCSVSVDLQSPCPQPELLGVTAPPVQTVFVQGDAASAIWRHRWPWGSSTAPLLQPYALSSSSCAFAEPRVHHCRAGLAFESLHVLLLQNLVFIIAVLDLAFESPHEFRT